MLLAFLCISFAPEITKSQNQKRILGDIDQQRISQVYDEDEREENIYRRPPTYVIIASRIVRPSTVYQVSSVNN